MIQGSRRSLEGNFHPEVLKRGYIVVSIDYRLAPETKLPGIIEDLQAAWRWLRQEGGRQFGIDPDRIAVAGGSAGGYLTLMTGFCVKPRPRVLVSYYGYGDITTPWYSQPDGFYRRQPLVPKEEAYRCVGDRTFPSRPRRTSGGDSICIAVSRGSGPRKWRAATRTASPSGSTRIARSAR